MSERPPLEQGPIFGRFGGFRRCVAGSERLKTQDGAGFLGLSEGLLGRKPTTMYSDIRFTSRGAVTARQNTASAVEAAL